GENCAGPVDNSSCSSGDVVTVDQAGESGADVQPGPGNLNTIEGNVPTCRSSEAQPGGADERVLDNSQPSAAIDRHAAAPNRVSDKSQPIAARGDSPVDRKSLQDDTGTTDGDRTL